MAIRESQRKAVAKYNAANYDRVELRLPKGRKAEVEAKASEKGETINNYVNSLIRNDLGLSDAEWGGEPKMRTLAQLRRILNNHGYGLRKKNRGEDSWLIIDTYSNSVAAGNEHGDSTPGLSTEEVSEWIAYMGWSNV